MFLTAYLCYWNQADNIECCLKGIYENVDAIIINEVCWVPGDWVGDTSPDGSAKIVKKFIEEYDKEEKIIFYQAGYTYKGGPIDQAGGRNAAIHLVPPQTTRILLLDCDEFYTEQSLINMRKILEEEDVFHYIIPAKCYYFDFSWYKNESFQRIWKWFPGQHFYLSASMLNPEQTARHFREEEGVNFFHLSYVGIKNAIKGCTGTDVSMEKFNRWRNEIFLKFNGDNLEELYKMNADGIHIFGGGRLDKYKGDFPKCLDEHPLRHKTWKEIIKEAKEKGEL